MRISCWIPKDTNTHSEYVLLIAFPLQQWLHERVSMLCQMYIVCHAISSADLLYIMLVAYKGQLKCDGTRAETRFRLSAKRTSLFKSAEGVSSVDYRQPRCARSAVVMLDTPCSEVV